jgi:hypothetical protein
MTRETLSVADVSRLLASVASVEISDKTDGHRIRSCGSLFLRAEGKLLLEAFQHAVSLQEKNSHILEKDGFSPRKQHRDLTKNYPDKAAKGAYPNLASGTPRH